MTNIYKAVLDSTDKTIVKHVVPHSQSQYGQNKAVVTDCLGPKPTQNRTGFSPGVTVPCVDGKQTWTGYYFPGLLTDSSKVTYDTSIQGKFKVRDEQGFGLFDRALVLLMFESLDRFLSTCTSDAWDSRHPR
jgi:hypothetical protein